MTVVKYSNESDIYTFRFRAGGRAWNSSFVVKYSPHNAISLWFLRYKLDDGRAGEDSGRISKEGFERAVGEKIFEVELCDGAGRE